MYYIRLSRKFLSIYKQILDEHIFCFILSWLVYVWFICSIETKERNFWDNIYFIAFIILCFHVKSLIEYI